MMQGLGPVSMPSVVERKKSLSGTAGFTNRDGKAGTSTGLTGCPRSACVLTLSR
jgi:hypothetical protein